MNGSKLSDKIMVESRLVDGGGVELCLLHIGGSGVDSRLRWR